MRIPSRAVLAAQMHCLSEDGQVVITAQRWTDPGPADGRPVTWLRLVRNGRERQVLRFLGVGAQLQVDGDWERWSGRYAQTALTEDQMWAKLRELVGVEQESCSSVSKCPGRLPVAWRWCPECGRDQRRVASGSLSGIRRRPVIRF